jgi:choline transport protein
MDSKDGGTVKKATRTSREATAPVEFVNASGHTQELQRSFSLLSLAGVGIVVGNVWPAVGSSVLLALYNGGPPGKMVAHGFTLQLLGISTKAFAGVLYEFITVSVFYWAVALSIAELASAIPSSAGVYHWASVTPGKRWGRVNGYFAGWWNYLAWVFGTASMSAILADILIQMYSLTHPDFESQAWHVFVTYIIVTWISCLLVCFFNQAMPYLNNVGIFFVVAGFFITIIVLAVMPGRGGRPPHATSSFVWTEWSADIGYSNGLVFVTGMLNGAFSVGVPDVVSHLAEEIPNPSRNVPIAIGLQMAIGFVTGFAYLIAIMYAINDLDAVFNAAYPIAEIYRQGTGSAAGAIGLLFLVLVCIFICLVGLYITSGRTLWTLARDGATPFANQLSTIHPSLHVPLNTTILSGILVTLLGCIYVGSTTAFNAFVGSYICMSSSSYIASILPHLLTRRKNITFGTFHMGRGVLGYAINAVSCGYMIVWFVLYCFPSALPVDASAMNYASLLWGGFTILLLIWWLVGAQKGYEGPHTTGGITGQEMAQDPVHVHADQKI